jgi:sugar-specific transcriptional regulator TrmB
VPDEVLTLSASLGLTSNEIRAYRAMLRFGSLSSTAAEIADAASITRPKVYETLKSLEQKGFCLATGDTVMRYRPVDPAVALQEWTRRRALERDAENARDGNLADQLHSLLPTPPDGEADPGGEFMHVASDPEQTMTMLTHFANRSSRQLDLIVTNPLIVEDDSETLVRAALERGAHVRVLYDTSLFREAPNRGAQIESAGAEVRSSDDLPLKMSLRDHGAEAVISLVSRSDSDIAAVAVSIRHPELCAPFQILFNRLWRQATSADRPQEQ